MAALIEYSQSPDYWLRIWQTHPGGTDHFKYGLDAYADPPDYHGGFAEPRLMDISDIARVSSNDRGEPEVSRCSVRWRDTDQTWLTRLDDPEKQSLSGAEGLIEMASTRARFSGTPARQLWRGVIREYGNNRGIDHHAVIESRIGSQFGPFGMDRPVQRLLIGAEDFPGAPATIKNKQTVPAVWGEHSDAGVSLSDGRSLTVGRMPGYYVGDYVVSSSQVVSVKHVTSGTTLLPPVVNLRATIVGAGGSKTYTYAVAAKTASGYTAAAYVTVTGAPSTSSFSPSNRVELRWDAYPNSEWNDAVEIHTVWVKEGTQSSAFPFKYMDEAGTSSDAAAREYDDDGDDSHNKPWGPAVPTKSKATITTTVTTTSNETITNVTRKRMFLFAAGYVKINQLFAHPVGEASDNPDRTEVSLDGPDFITPDSSAWPFADPWYTAESGREYTIVLGEGPRADLIVEGRGSIGANGCGYTEDGRDGTPMVGGAFYQLFRVLNDFILAEGGDGYTSGAFPATVTWPGSTTIPILNYDSFEACQAYTRRKLGNDIGWLGHIYIGDGITVREFLRRFAVTFDCYYYENAHGQFCVGILDELADASAAQPLREGIECPENCIGALTVHDEMVENEISVSHGYHPDLRRFLSEPAVYRDGLSISRHKGGPRPSAIEHWYTNDPVTSASSAGHRLMRLNYAPRYHDVMVNYAPGVHVEIGGQHPVTARAIVGASRVMLVRKHRTVVASRTKRAVVVLRMLDVSRFAGMWNPAVQAFPMAASNVYAFEDSRALVR